LLVLLLLFSLTLQLSLPLLLLFVFIFAFAVLVASLEACCAVRGFWGCGTQEWNLHRTLWL
jgi:hypothetical protein